MASGAARGPWLSWEALPAKARSFGMVPGLRPVPKGSNAHVYGQRSASLGFRAESGHLESTRGRTWASGVEP